MCLKKLGLGLAQYMLCAVETTRHAFRGIASHAAVPTIECTDFSLIALIVFVPPTGFIDVFGAVDGIYNFFS